MAYPTYRRWDVVRVNFPDMGEGCAVLCGPHPAIIISQDYVCAKSPCLMVVHGTSSLDGADKYAGQVVVEPSKEYSFGLFVPTKLDCSRVTTIDVSWIQHRMGTIINTPYVGAIEKGLRETLNLPAETGEYRPKKLLFTFCPSCQARFVVDGGLKTVVCRACGTQIDLTARHKYKVRCPSCKVEWYGETTADPQNPPCTRCKCGEDIPLGYNPDSDTFTAAEGEMAPAGVA